MIVLVIFRVIKVPQIFASLMVRIVHQSYLPSPPSSPFIGNSLSVKNIWGPSYINHVAACFHLSVMLDSQKHKGCLMVMVDPLDLVHGINSSNK